MNKSYLEIYLSFWASMFSSSLTEIEGGAFLIKNSGYYLDRHVDKYLFFFSHFESGTEFLAMTDQVKALLFSNVCQTDFPRIASSLSVQTVFNDLDYILIQPSDFRPQNSRHRIKVLDQEVDSEMIQKFLDHSTEDDKDTLDLTFDNEVAVGVIEDNEIIGIARYGPIRNSGLADITVLVLEKHRGRGLGAPLTSELVRNLICAGYAPKYRVDHKNMSSRKIAERLGFIPFSRLQVWEVEHLKELNTFKAIKSY